MYGYIYLITNRVNGKIYIGQHKYDKMELDPSYHGSGYRLHDAYKKYGMNKFDTTLIDTGDTKEELDQKEIFYIDVLDCRNPDVGYNIAEGGGGCALPGEKNGMYGKHHTEEAKQKMRDYKRTDEHRQHLSEALTGKKLTDEHKQKLRDRYKDKTHHPMYGKHHTEEAKQKISETRNKYTGENHPMYGKQHTDESKQKMRDVWTEEKREQMSEKRTGKNNPAFGRKWMNNGIEKKFVLPDDVDKYLQNGWTLGKLNKVDESLKDKSNK